MESNWAAENLQVIRTLMERSAVYRRALAPIMTFNGMLGLLAAMLGWLLRLNAPRSFISFWAGISILGVVGSFLLVRRQALKAREPYWSPPTRRVAVAILPPLAAGFIVTAVSFFYTQAAAPAMATMAGMVWLPLVWVVLYGCALHAAGFFMPRGTKIFGWAFVLGGSLLFGLGLPDRAARPEYAYAIMGFFFGALHLGYGIYLYFTEKRTNAA